MVKEDEKGPFLGGDLPPAKLADKINPLMRWGEEKGPPAQEGGKEAGLPVALLKKKWKPADPPLAAETLPGLKKGELRCC